MVTGGLTWDLMRMTKLIERFYDSKIKLEESLLRNTRYQLEKAIQANAEVTLFVSGGSSPKQLYLSLSQVALPWQCVQVAMVDERWVELTHSKSNQQFIQNTLIRHKAFNVKFHTMKRDAPHAKEVASLVSDEYAQLKSPGITILGMGSDGHTASLFPNAVGLNDALNSEDKLCSAIEAIKSEVTGEQTERMTMTLKALMQSQIIYLVLSGEEKLKVYRNALGGKDVRKMPVRAILHQSKVPVVVYWAP